MGSSFSQDSPTSLVPSLPTENVVLMTKSMFDVRITNQPFQATFVGEIEELTGVGGGTRCRQSGRFPVLRSLIGHNVSLVSRT